MRNEVVSPAGYVHPPTTLRPRTKGSPARGNAHIVAQKHCIKNYSLLSPFPWVFAPGTTPCSEGLCIGEGC